MNRTAKAGPRNRGHFTHAERSGETVTITLAPTTDLHAVTLSILNATTDDERCATLGEADLGCFLGDI